MSCLRQGFSSPLPAVCADGATLRGNASTGAWECNPAVRANLDGDLEADGDFSAGTTDDNVHVLQGMTSILGDPNEQILTVFGHGMMEYLNVVRELRIWGGQYPSYYGYGTDGVFYPGTPYYGSYADDAVGPFHGTGTTIDVRGARFDEAPLMERGFWVIDEDDGQYYRWKPFVNPDGSPGWDVSGPWPYEPHAEPT